MDVEKELLGMEPHPEYIKRLLNNIYIMRDCFPIEEREHLYDILGGEDAEIMVYTDPVPVRDIVESIMSPSEKVRDPDQIINCLVGEDHINVFIRFLLWGETLRVSYPVTSDDQVEVYRKRLLALGVDPERVLEPAGFPIEGPEELFLRVILSNPELVGAAVYERAAAELESMLGARPSGPPEDEVESEVLEFQEEEPLPGIEVPPVESRTAELFVPSDKNRFILTAVMTVAKMPSGAYNPLFVFGPPGSGKTHLIHAVRNEIEKRHSGMQTLAISGADMHSTDTLTLSRAEVVVIDDLDLGLEADNVGTSELLFGLLDDGKQIIASMSSDPATDPRISPVLERYEGHLVEETHELDDAGGRSLLQAWIDWINRSIGDSGMDLEIIPGEGVLEEIWNGADGPDNALETLMACAGILLSSGSGNLSMDVLGTIPVEQEAPQSREEEPPALEPEDGAREVEVQEWSSVGPVTDPEAPDQVDVSSTREDGGAVEIPADANMTEAIPGLTYLLETEALNGVYELLRVMSDRGRPTLAICRTNPKILIHRHRLSKEDVVWLTEKQSSEYHTETPVLENILYLLDEYLDSRDDEAGGAILLDGLEYLISSSNFNTVLKFIRHIVDTIAETGFVCFVPVSPTIVSEQELRILEKEMEKISGMTGCRLEDDHIFIAIPSGPASTGEQ